mgnify:FL=1
MLYGLYLSAQGADVQSLRQDVLANNIANSSTTGFKRDQAIIQGHPSVDFQKSFEAADPTQRARQTGGVSLAQITTDFRTASMLNSGRQYDVALKGSGFLQVRDGDQEFLTRNGRMKLNDGTLVMEDTGLPILSDAGANIEIPINVTRMEINKTGQMSGYDSAGNLVFNNQLAVVNTDTSKLEKVGLSLFRPHAELDRDFGTEVRQGAVEASGCNPIKEMTSMIEAGRSFEANITMIRMQDESLGRLLQSVGG